MSMAELRVEFLTILLVLSGPCDRSGGQIIAQINAFSVVILRDDWRLPFLSTNRRA